MEQRGNSGPLISGNASGDATEIETPAHPTLCRITMNNVILNHLLTDLGRHLAAIGFAVLSFPF
jgi:hypothetical protein